METGELDEIILEEIDFYEGWGLERIQPGEIDISGILNANKFIQVNSINLPAGDKAEHAYNERMLDLVMSAYGASKYLNFLCVGQEQRLNVYLSTGGSKNLAKSLLSSIYPGIVITDSNSSKIIPASISSLGLITGYPSPKQGRDNGQIAKTELPIEKVVRAMKDSTWLFMVQAFRKEKKDSLTENRKELMNKLAYYSSVSSQQYQKSIQTNKTEIKNETRSFSETIGAEKTNKVAAYLVELLEKELARVNIGFQKGWWQVGVYYGSDTVASAERLGNLLCGGFSGDNSSPRFLRNHLSSASSLDEEHQFHTYIHSEELSHFVELPFDERPGYGVTRIEKLDLNVRFAKNESIKLGKVLDFHKATNEDYSVPLEDLNRHTAIFGMTGGGKTTAVMNLVSNLWENQIPFLVIEPAKTEYRSLLGKIDENGNVLAPIVKNLRVYTLGQEAISPFRLNPFEFETDDKIQQCSVLQHIDYLKAAFNAAFILYAPMPYVLDIALHEIYSDKGWDLISGVNSRLSIDEWNVRQRFPIFPTFRDLNEKVRKVTVRFGYETRIEQNVIASLQARIGSLRIGSKGAMFDVPRGIATDRLLRFPTVMELQGIGNDEEKTFVIGLLLAKIYGYFKLKERLGEISEKIAHVTILEEAHRILASAEAHVDTESSNLRSQAVQTFTNMLSEIRYYGAGAIIVEQIPSKISQDVIKNTNLKIVHRMTSKEDRDIVASTINMNEVQSTRISLLNRGEAVVFAEGDDFPCLIRLDDFKQQNDIRPVPDSLLSLFAQKKVSLKSYYAIPDFSQFDIAVNAYGIPDLSLIQYANRFCQSGVIKKYFSEFFLGIQYTNSAINQLVTGVSNKLRSENSIYLREHSDKLLMMTLLIGANAELYQRADERNWDFNQTDTMFSIIARILHGFIYAGVLDEGEFKKFVNLFKANTKKEVGPYPGCLGCTTICTLNLEVSRLVSSRHENYVKSILSESHANQEDKYNSVLFEVEGIIGEIKNIGLTNSLPDVLLCFTSEIGSRIGLSEEQQQRFVSNVIKQKVAARLP